jgi:hypothetical protein
VEVKDRYHFYAPPPWINGNGGVNLDGVVAVGYFGKKEFTGAAQWFKDTGELWAFSNAITFERGGVLLLAWGDLLRNLVEYLDSSLQFLAKTGVTGPIMVEAGVTNLNGVAWPGENRGVYSGLADEAYFSLTSSTWTVEERYQFIAKTLSAIATTYGRPAISVDYVKANA